MRRIAVLYPTRERAPGSIEKLGREIALLSGHPHQHHVRFIVGLDNDDPTLLEAMSAMRGVHEAALRKGAAVEVRIGTSRDKVHAMNRLVPDPDSFDAVIGHSDDMEILADNWDDIAVRPLFERFPDGDGTVLIPDGNRADILTWPVVGAEFLRRLPWNAERSLTTENAENAEQEKRDRESVCSEPDDDSEQSHDPDSAHSATSAVKNLWDPRYRAICCDDALTEVAIRRNRLHYGSPAIVRHAHPAYQTRERDQTDRKWTPLEAADRDTLERHQAEGGGGFGVRRPTLSILTPTIPGREGALDRLRAVLADDVGHTTAVEWIVGRFSHRRDGGPTMGEVRNRMLAAALGEWVMFIDDDDVLTPGSVRRIVAALGESDADVLGFDLLYRGENGGEVVGWRRYRHRHGLAWVDGTSIVDGVSLRGTRPINHVNPVRKSIAMAIGFGDNRNQQEDYDFATQLAKSHLVHREAFLIGDPVYIYETPNDPQRRWHELEAVEKEAAGCTPRRSCAPRADQCGPSRPMPTGPDAAGRSRRTTGSRWCPWPSCGSARTMCCTDRTSSSTRTTRCCSSTTGRARRTGCPCCCARLHAGPGSSCCTMRSTRRLRMWTGAGGSSR